MKINVYIGVKGSGKGYASRKAGGIKISFADKLRDMVWTLVGWRPKSDKDYERFKRMTFSCDEVSFTGRDILDRLGTDIVRSIDDEYWIDKVYDKLYKHQKGGEKLVCIDDARFVNEIEMLKGINEFQTRLFDVNFIFCDYHSKRYDPNGEHECEKLAQGFLKQGFKHGDSLNEVIYGSGKWKDFLDT